MQRAEKESCSTEAYHANAKDEGCLPRRRSQVVRAPTERLRRVVMDDKADDQPDRKYNPRVRMAELQSPDVPADEDGEGESFSERENSSRFPVQHTKFKPA